MAYNLHDLRVKGIEVAEILSCSIEGRMGEHGALALEAYAKEGEEALYEFPDCQPVEVYAVAGGGTETLFSGVLTAVRMEVRAQSRIVRVEGKTWSWMMDRVRKSRSFQDTQMSCRDVAELVMQDYPGSSLLYVAQETPVGELIVQYEETDWAFLKRVMSIIGTTVTPEGRRSGILLYAGVPTLQETELSYRLLRMEKDMGSFYKLKANGRQVYAADFTGYEVASGQLLGIFERALTGGGTFVADSFQYVFDGQEMTGRYGLRTTGGLLRARRYPMQLIGLALMGKVTNVAGDKVQVLLDIDRGSGILPVYWFVYSTMSASPDGSGWYCMPEIGDAVRVYFPSKHEKEAVALSAVNSYGVPGGGQTDRMQDPNSRYLRTKSGQQLSLSPGYLQLSCAGGSSSVTVRSDGSVVVSGTNVVINGEEKITFHADQKLTVHALQSVTLQSMSGGCVGLAGGAASFQGTEVTFD